MAAARTSSACIIPIGPILAFVLAPGHPRIGAVVQVQAGSRLPKLDDRAVVSALAASSAVPGRLRSARRRGSAGNPG